MRVDSIERWPAWAWVASNPIPFSCRRVKQVWRSWWHVSRSTPARLRASYTIWSSPYALRGRPRRSCLSATNTRSVSVAGRSSLR